MLLCFGEAFYVAKGATVAIGIVTVLILGTSTGAARRIKKCPQRSGAKRPEFPWNFHKSPGQFHVISMEFPWKFHGISPRTYLATDLDLASNPPLRRQKIME